MLMACIMTIQKYVLPLITTVTILTTMQQYAASLSVNNEATIKQNDNVPNVTPQEGADNLKIPSDQILLVRLPSNILFKYKSYKDVTLLHFRIPPDTRRATFTFKAIEESKNAFQSKCKPRDVTLHLKANSYPVISPENITFPINFLRADQRFKIYNLHFQSNGRQERITVEGPQVGNWYAVAFVNWADPNNDRIEQQGLSLSCSTLLSAEMSVSRFHPIIIDNGQMHNSTLTREEQNLASRSNGKKVIKTAECLQQCNQQGKPHLAGKDSVRNSDYTKKSEVGRTNSIEKITEESKQASETKFYTQTSSSDLTNQSRFSTYTSTTTSKPYSENKIKNNRCDFTNANNEIIYKFYVPSHMVVAKAHIKFGQVCFQCPDVEFQVQANAVPNNEAEDDKSRKNNYLRRTVIKPNQTGEISIEFNTQPMTWHYALLKFLTQTGLEIESESSASTACYHLSFVLQITYHDTLSSTQKGVAKKNAHINRFSETCERNSSEYYNFVNNSNQNEKLPRPWHPQQFRDMKFYPVLRQTYGEFFKYDYDLVPDENGTVPTVLNLTACMSIGFAFDVGEVYDIGGTLSFAVSMKYGDIDAGHATTETMPSIPINKNNEISVEKLIVDPDKVSINDDDDVSNDKNLSRSYQTIIVCMHLGEPGKPTWPNKCQYGERLLSASIIVNNTDSNTNAGLIHVPFPESGQWYVTMGLFCHGAGSASRAAIIDHTKEFVKKYAYVLENMRKPCACASKLLQYRNCFNDPDCLSAMNETETLQIKKCLMDSNCTANHAEMTQIFEVHHKIATEKHLASESCSTSVVFTISSSPCVAGRCGRYGHCYHYMSGGFVFSTCVCMKGYRGWDCTEDSQVSSSMSILNAFLLLTTSNILFLPSICIAGRRQFYNEAIIYFFTMFFSILYHACDSGEDVLNFCLAEIKVLQFCDFYCGLLAIWVTLVAMSHIRHQFVSLLHILGAILLAFGTELNKQSLWIFLAPALIGVFLISTSWGVRCFQYKKLFPSRRYLLIYMPVGTVLAMVGLVCYGFLQTKQNYYIVHSVWHIVMALSILCLLPSHNSRVKQW